MIIRLSDKYNIDNSIKNILSIRWNPGGLSFSLYDPAEKDNYLYQEVLFEPSVPYITSLKDCFFENTFFTWPFQKTYIVCVSSFYTLIPGMYYKEKSQEQFLSYNFKGPKEQSLINRIANPDAVVAFRLSEDIYEFCSRSFIHPYYIHHLTPLLELWQKQSLAHPEKQMNVVFREGFLDIVCYRQGQLGMVNSFPYTNPNDALYYILYVWQKTGMEQIKDFFLYTGDAPGVQIVLSNLATYLNNIRRMEIPSEAYLKGGDILKAPLDLITLFI
ncbi:MAG: DUF3822 family protein [Tannerellaceae bacterium]|nr:DUF3822 family protein [Tannerellaceae bacterium]